MALLGSSLLVDTQRYKIIKKVHASNAGRDQHVSYDILQRVITTHNPEGDWGYTRIEDVEKKCIIKPILKTEWWDHRITNTEYETARLDVDSALTYD